MKHLTLFFLILFIFTSCKKEEVSIAEKHSDDYRIQWIGHIYDSIEGIRKNYELLELLIPKDKNKDTLFNQSKSYINGELDEKYSIYYDLEVIATEKKHVYKAFIQFHSEYSNLQTNEYKRDIEVSFLNYYRDSLAIETKNFDNTDSFEIEFVNYYNDRFTGRFIEYIEEDIKEEPDKVILHITKIVVTNKTTTSNFFIVNDSIFDQQKFSLEGIHKTE